ncbi:MAG TPA: lantibiotic ABC transporter, partial [Bacteroidia bacterium]|nr:lantibiotic ABC transporter [Bacteroidia bacterium]
MTHKIKNFKPFIGQHCETTATGSLIKQLGIELSEPMLFGLGEGLGYIFWNMKIMDFPFIGGRVKPDVLTQNIARNLNLKLEIKETSSIKKAWDNVVDNIEKDIPVGVKLDCYYLEYFTNKIHFAGHYVAMY